MYFSILVFYFCHGLVTPYVEKVSRKRRLHVVEQIHTGEFQVVKEKVQSKNTNYVRMLVIVYIQ
jgi:hypothetical protein